MKLFPIIIAGMMTVLGVANAASTESNRDAYVAKSVNSLDKIGVYARGAC